MQKVIQGAVQQGSCDQLAHNKSLDQIKSLEAEIKHLRVELDAMRAHQARAPTKPVGEAVQSSSWTSKSLFPPYQLAQTWGDQDYCLEIPQGSNQPDNFNRTTQVDVYVCGSISQFTTDGRDKWIFEGDGRIMTQLAGIGLPKCLTYGEPIVYQGGHCPDCGASVIV